MLYTQSRARTVTPSSYIGETGRALGRKVTEHKYAVKSGDQKNGVAVHA